MNGFGLSLWRRGSSRSWRSGRGTEWDRPRRSALSVSSRNQRSTRFNHDDEVGVKCMWKRGVFGQPRPDGGVFVGGVVVADQMHLQAFRDLPVDLAQEPQELDVPMPGQAVTDHHAGEHVQCREQDRSPVALVVVGHRRRPATLHRQGRLGPIQCLHRGLLVQTQHQRVVRRVQIQPDDIDQLR